MPTVSICIPTYNRREYLRESLDSVMAQTYKDFEVVIVDDGSTDDTSDMIKKTGYDVRYFWQENRGEAATCNKLIKLANAKYVSFVHSDDLLVPDAIERMVNAVNSEPENIVVYGSYIRIDEQGNYCGRCKRRLFSGYITQHLFEDHIVHACGSMFPKKVLEEVGGFDTSLRACYDYKLELQLSLKYRFIALTEPTFKRRRHSSNTSQNSFANRKTELDVLTEFYYNGGGKEVIPKRIAIRRLSKESYRAGRWAIKEGLFDQACRLLGKSFKLHPNPKSLIHWTRATINKCLVSF